nr:uncharacterized protein LOC108384825 [Manis javanica]
MYGGGGRGPGEEPALPGRWGRKKEEQRQGGLQALKSRAWTPLLLLGPRSVGGRRPGDSGTRRLRPPASSWLHPLPTHREAHRLEQKVLQKGWPSVGCPPTEGTQWPRTPPPIQCDLSGGSRTHCDLEFGVGSGILQTSPGLLPGSHKAVSSGPDCAYAALGPSSSTVLDGLTVKLLTLSGKDGLWVGALGSDLQGALKTMEAPDQRPLTFTPPMGVNPWGKGNNG